jgi:hypothetical protein
MSNIPTVTPEDSENKLPEDSSSIQPKIGKHEAAAREIANKILSGEIDIPDWLKEINDELPDNNSNPSKQNNMSKIIKPLVLAICISVIAFIISDKFIGPTYSYYKKELSKETKDGLIITYTYWIKITQDDYYGIKEGNENMEKERISRKKYGYYALTLTETKRVKLFNYKALIISLAVAVGSFTLMFKTNNR